MLDVYWTSLNCDGPVMLGVHLDVVDELRPNVGRVRVPTLEAARASQEREPAQECYTGVALGTGRPSSRALLCCSQFSKKHRLVSTISDNEPTH